LLVLTLGRVAAAISNFILLTPFTRSAVYEEDDLSLTDSVTNAALFKKDFGEKDFLNERN
jgi:hypothetical protein